MNIVKADKLAHTLTIHVNSLKNLTSTYTTKTQNKEQTKLSSKGTCFTEKVDYYEVNVKILGIGRS